MKLVKVFTILPFFFLFPLFADSEIVELPAGPYGGQFQDTETGKVWLQYNVLQYKPCSEIVETLSISPFRLATRAEVEKLFSSLHSIPTEAIGSSTRCTGHIGCVNGIFDDSATGTDPTLHGYAVIQWSLYESPPNYYRNITDDHIPFDTSHCSGAWAVQRAPALCATSEANSSDLDCDGKDEKVVWRKNSGTWYLRFSKSNELLVQQWGLPGDHPILGDYDGDHIADLVVWRPSNGTWYVKTSSSLFDGNQAIVQQFGLPGDRPLRGDFDGDGILDFAVWRPSEGNWYVLRSGTKQIVVEQWGLPGDVPLTNLPSE